ncbi:MAG: hypothetical protein GC178_16320 [Flavobacteriales bacterium]|nr:hypothetical protein [Flavobacteriales bacterium]
MRNLNIILLCALAVSLAMTACKKNEDKDCLELDTTASFVVDGTALTVTHTPVWTSSGIYQSLGFRHDLAGGGQHIVTIIFEGDSIGTYPLKGQLDPHRAMYMGPNSNNNALFTGPGETGTVTITDMDLSNGCLTGNYSFTANFVQVTGEFQSLRPQ